MSASSPYVVLASKVRLKKDATVSPAGGSPIAEGRAKRRHRKLSKGVQINQESLNSLRERFRRVQLVSGTGNDSH